MPVIAIQGLRGGAGATSLTAAFAWALSQLGEATIAVDFSADNLLGMHFNMPAGLSRGWLRAAVDQQPWQQSAMRYAPQLDFIPFGQLSDEEKMDFAARPLDFFSRWPAQLAELKQHYSWILLDIPAGDTPWTRTLLAGADRTISVIVPDANCHIRLHQQRFLPGTLHLINQFSPLNRARQDIHQLWLSSLHNLIPLTIHLDEAVAEALLNKQPLGEYRPLSLAAEGMMTLANWALINLRGKTA
ncbi:cellulose biosynthesis protein BcsQ [Erwinia mallotivora]|uniref:cellulose biosynthesis protein BcsQ n=1 Tax=Erwinia mallotivora TaxID=69222 RepID=UPI0021BF9DD5|nr:cellulose biosynthesis protein BcsQ [Erwinia mallotivora]